VFDGRRTKSIGVPNYAVDPDDEDREHELRKDMGDLFERDADAKGGHSSTDPPTFYELCMEMLMVRIARTRRALRSRNYELVFGYTSGLDLIGHVSYDLPELQDGVHTHEAMVAGTNPDIVETIDSVLDVKDAVYTTLKDGTHESNKKMLKPTQKVEPRRKSKVS
jgi:hypothetical protein